MHVGYAEEREDLFIMALPATKCSAKEVSQAGIVTGSLNYPLYS